MDVDWGTSDDDVDLIQRTPSLYTSDDEAINNGNATQNMPSGLLDISLDTIKYILSWCTKGDIARFSVVSNESCNIATKC